jgi:hypothetical protein
MGLEVLGGWAGCGRWRGGLLRDVGVVGASASAAVSALQGWPGTWSVGNPVGAAACVHHCMESGHMGQGDEGVGKEGKGYTHGACLSYGCTHASVLLLILYILTWDMF